MQDTGQNGSACMPRVEQGDGDRDYEERDYEERGEEERIIRRDGRWRGSA